MGTRLDLTIILIVKSSRVVFELHDKVPDLRSRTSVELYFRRVIEMMLFVFATSDYFDVYLQLIHSFIFMISS
jgi:hypothetical protein